MKRRNLIIAALALGAGAAIFSNSKVRNKILTTGKLTQEPVTLGSETLKDEPIKGSPRVDIKTSKGTFTVELRPDLAPKTVTNFLSKWANDYCTGKTFHRVEDWVVQGCDPKGDGTGGETNLATETSSEPFVAGSIGVARKSFPKDLSNDSQFFVVKKDSTFLNGDYTYFGRVVSGMDVVNSISIGDTILSTTLLSK